MRSWGLGWAHATREGAAAREEEDDKIVGALHARRVMRAVARREQDGPRREAEVPRDLRTCGAHAWGGRLAAGRGARPGRAARTCGEGAP
eukprot:2432429-Prymnesium_polylepis.1